MSVPSGPASTLGDPGETAHAVRFFVESGFATGAILTVDGGRLIAGRDQQFFQDCSYPSMTTRN